MIRKVKEQRKQYRSPSLSQRMDVIGRRIQDYCSSRKSTRQSDSRPISRQSFRWPISNKQNKSQASSSSPSYLLQSYADGEGSDTYIPERSQRSSKDQEESDNEQDIRDMRQIAEQNREYLREFMSTDVQGNIRSSSRLKEAKQMGFFMKLWNFMYATLTFKHIIIGILMILVVILYIRMNFNYNYEGISKLGQGISPCWDNFKKERCDLYNPTSTFCKELLQCTLNQQRQRNINQASPKSHIQIFCIGGIVLISLYLLGVRKTFILFVHLYYFCKKIYNNQKNNVQMEKQLNKDKRSK